MGSYTVVDYFPLLFAWFSCEENEKERQKVKLKADYLVPTHDVRYLHSA
jgi:hypothetical protein